MIEVQQIADFLNTELNNIGKSQGYNFDIKAEVGERTNQDAIYGIVITTKADARVDENVDYVFAVELSVPSAKTNENVINVEKIIGEFKNKFHMKNRAFGGGQGTLLISLATPKDYQIKYVVGDDVPLVFTITTEYIRNAVGSGDKHWLLNGMEIPFINESVSVQKEGRTNTIHGESYTKTLLTRQTRYYKFGFDYDNSELCIMLKKDLLDGKYDKVYTLTYYDGVSFTEEQPFTTSVSIFANGQSSSTKPNVSEFDITFTDVDNEVKATYEIALIDNPFDSTTENTRYFPNEEEQRDYYQKEIDKDIRYPGGVGCMFVKIKAPNLSSIDLTNQVYEIPLNDGEPIYDVLSVANKNYAIIKVKKGEEEQWFYYYVSNQNIGGQNQVMFDLKLDSVQTYCIGDKLQFGECLIERGHLNRWVDNGDGTVSFDGTVDSKLFEREDIQNVAKRMAKRTRLNLYEQYPEDLSNALDEMIAGWIYVYLDPTHEYDLAKISSEGGDVKSKLHSCSFQVFNNEKDYWVLNTTIPSPLGVIVAPIYNTSDKQIKFKVSGIERLCDFNYLDTIYTLFNSEVLENSYDYVYSIKFSTIPPFDFDTVPQYSFDENGNIILNINTVYSGEAAASSSSIPNMYFYSAANGALFMNITYQKSYIQMTYSASKELTFNKSDIINSNKDVKFNPKLLNNDYYALTLTNELAERFEYDYQKLNTKDNVILYTESLTPDIARQYMRIKLNDGVYLKNLEETLFGLVSSNDNTIAYISDAYKSMLANQKNYFLQTERNRDYDLGQSLINNSAQGISQSIGGNGWGSVASQLMGGLNAGLNFQRGIMNQNFTLDNIKNAPANIAGAKGNTVFEASYTKPGAYVEEWDILPNEKEIINDYMCKYGFTVNRFGNPKEYDNIRHYYNYVKAQIDSISGIAISNQARDDIRQRFANGVRFWKQDNIDYSKENYEERLVKTSIIIENRDNLKYSIIVNDIEYPQNENGVNEIFIDSKDAIIELKYYAEEKYRYTVTYNKDAVYSNGDNNDTNNRTIKFIMGNLSNFKLEVYL